MKILFVLPSLGVGGAERVVINLANEFQKRECQVVIVTLNNEINNEILLSEMHREIKLIDLKLRKSRFILLKPYLFGKLLREEKPDVVFAAYGEINPLISPFKFFFKNIFFLARESSIPSVRITRNDIRILYKLLYRFHDCIVVQSLAMQQDMNLNYSIAPQKNILIPNPLVPESIELRKAYKGDEEKISKFNSFNGIKLLLVGSLSEHKGGFRTIAFVRKLRENGGNYCLQIVGSGPLENDIKQYITDNELDSFVFLSPTTKNPFAYMDAADFLIVASDYEGYPNVAVEANYCGKPVIISSRTIGGAKEVLSADRINGDIMDFENPDINVLQKRYNATTIKEYILNKHLIDKVASQYTELFKRFKNTAC